MDNVNPRKCQSASGPNADGSQSPPDPLEPWSMNGIASMSKILAWETEDDSI